MHKPMRNMLIFTVFIEGLLFIKFFQYKTISYGKFTNSSYIELF